MVTRRTGQDMTSEGSHGIRGAFPVVSQTCFSRGRRCERVAESMGVGTQDVHEQKAGANTGELKWAYEMTGFANKGGRVR